MRAATVGHGNALRHLLLIEIEDDDLEARVAANPQFVCIRIWVQRSVIAADAVGDELVYGPFRLFHQRGIDEADDLAPVMGFFALADDVKIFVVPAKMGAVRSFHARARHAHDLVRLAIILEHAARHRAGEIGVFVVRAERDPDRSALLDRTSPDHLPVVGADSRYDVAEGVLAGGAVAETAAGDDLLPIG